MLKIKLSVDRLSLGDPPAGICGVTLLAEMELCENTKRNETSVVFVKTNFNATFDRREIHFESKFIPKNLESSSDKVSLNNNNKVKD